MVRISKQSERRGQSRRRCQAPAKPSGPKKDNLPSGFKIHANSIEGEFAANVFIPKIR